ncbi:STAS domain-containing protein [Streptomyces xanthochromogenes]|uniref:STAS domain-containing protein n=1 Tax=Streptomyces xanthochromogenes TaxID=67384 RepID=UPI003817C662
MADSPYHPGPIAAQYAHKGCHVIVARGELDLDTTPDLTAALAKAADEHDVVVIDLSAVTFADSALLNLLLRTHGATTLRIAAPHPRIMLLLELTGADQALHVFTNLDDACATDLS